MPVIGLLELARLHFDGLAIDEDARPRVLDREPHDALLADENHAAVTLDDILALLAAFPSIRQADRLEVGELAAVEPLEGEAVLRCHLVGRVLHDHRLALGELIRRGLHRGAVRRNRSAETEFIERDIEHVATHIAKGAGAPIDSAAPVERRVAVLVRAVGGDAEEEVPRKFSRHGVGAFWTRVALRPPASGTVGPRVDLLDRADGAVADELAAVLTPLGGDALGSHLGDDAGLASRNLGQPSVLPRALRERLLTIDMLAEIHGRHRDRRVHVVRGRAANGVEVLVELGVGLAPVLEGRDIGEARLDGLALVVLGILDPAIKLNLAHIAEADDFDHLVVGQFAEVGSAHATDADLQHAQLLILTKATAKDRRCGTGSDLRGETAGHAASHAEGNWRCERGEDETAARDAHVAHSTTKCGAN